MQELLKIAGKLNSIKANFLLYSKFLSMNHSILIYEKLIFQTCQSINASQHYHYNNRIGRGKGNRVSL